MTHLIIKSKRAGFEPCSLSSVPVGVWSGWWGVTMEGPPCSLQGSSVVIECQYDYPRALNRVTSVTWSKYHRGVGRWISLKNLLAPPDSDYVGNFDRNCSLRLNRLRLADTGHYRFSFETKLDRWTSKDWVYVSVKGAKIHTQKNTHTNV